MVIPESGQAKPLYSLDRVISKQTESLLFAILRTFPIFPCVYVHVCQDNLQSIKEYLYTIATCKNQIVPNDDRYFSQSAVQVVNFFALEITNLNNTERTDNMMTNNSICSYLLKIRVNKVLLQHMCMYIFYIYIQFYIRKTEQARPACCSFFLVFRAGGQMLLHPYGNTVFAVRSQVVW